jgi:hypothetical protein
MLPCEQKELQVIFTASVGTKPGTLAPPVTLGDMRAPVLPLNVLA